jgi:hypothetical protein
MSAAFSSHGAGQHAMGVQPEQHQPLARPVPLDPAGGINPPRHLIIGAELVGPEPGNLCCARLAGDHRRAAAAPWCSALAQVSCRTPWPRKAWCWRAIARGVDGGWLVPCAHPPPTRRPPAGRSSRQLVVQRTPMP